MTLRPDETWFRLREWTYGQAPSERLAALILDHEGYASIDPSHPLGGPDGGKDALCTKNGKRCVMAVHFPRGERPFGETKTKFLGDADGARRNGAEVTVFVTNQEVRLAERDELRAAAAPLELDLYHLERIATVLDRPAMAPVLRQYLFIDRSQPTVVAPIAAKTVLLVDDLRLLRKLLRGAMNDARSRRAPLQRSTYAGLGSEYDPTLEELITNWSVDDGTLNRQLRSFVLTCKRCTQLIAEATVRRALDPRRHLLSGSLETELQSGPYARALADLEQLFVWINEGIERLG